MIDDEYGDTFSKHVFTDWQVQQTVVAREQKYIDGWPSLDNLQNVIVAVYFS